MDPIAVTAGIVQTGLYLDFFYVYFTKCVSHIWGLFLYLTNACDKGAQWAEIRASRLMYEMCMYACNMPGL